MRTGLEFLSDKTEPDFRNSIKESISAVEAICKKIVNDQNTTLGIALKRIQKYGAIKMHEDMKEAFQKLYGYTNDSGGIRHSLVDDDRESDFDDAKMMLVSCSAFVNYLVSKSIKAGIELK